MADARTTLLDKLDTFAASSGLITVSTVSTPSFIESQYGDGSGCGEFGAY